MDHHLFKEIPISKQDSDSNQDLRQTCSKCFNETNTRTFPGSMPVNFSRRFFSIVQTKKYFVSEKTDGIRFLLFCIDRKAYLCDRKFEFYLIEKFDWLGETLGSKGPTLLDGEMIHHEATHQAIFLIFDIVMLDGVYCGNEPLMKRCEKISFVVKNFRENSRGSTFQLLGKTFLPIKKIEILVKRIENIKEHRVYVERESDPNAIPKRFHKTDGIIFTPSDEPYQTRTCSNLFKWKYLDLYSIDLRTKVHNENLVFSFGLSDEKEHQYDIHLSEAHKQELLQNPNVNSPNGCIVEYSYDQHTGNWVFKLLRPDKDRPNFVTVVTDTLTSIAENISLKEITYRVVLDPSEDNWNFEFKKKLREKTQLSSFIVT